MVALQPPLTTNYMVRPGKDPELVDVISELGIFGYVIGWLNHFPIVLVNTFATLRTIIITSVVLMPYLVVDNNMIISIVAGTKTQ